MGMSSSLLHLEGLESYETLLRLLELYGEAVA